MAKLKIDQLDLMRRERLALAKLTDQQKAFCENWVLTFDKLSALKAGGYWTPKSDGGSQLRLLNNNFERIMAHPHVQEYILLLKQSVASRLGVSMDQLINQYKTLAFANMDDYVEWTSAGFTRIKSSSELTEDQKAGIMEITETTTKAGKVIKIKLFNKQAALDRLFDILQSLERDESEQKDRPAQITQIQINQILQDPVKRRAVEHLASGLFDKRIHLTSYDKKHAEFQKRVEEMSMKLLENMDGTADTVDARCQTAENSKRRAGEAEDGSPDGEIAQPQETGHSRNQGQACETGSDDADSDADVEGQTRYDIDGL